MGETNQQEIRLCEISRIRCYLIFMHDPLTQIVYSLESIMLCFNIYGYPLLMQGEYAFMWLGNKQLFDRPWLIFSFPQHLHFIGPFSFPLTNATMFPHVTQQNPKLANWPTQRHQQQHPPHAHNYQQQRHSCSCSLPSDPRLMHPAFTTGFQWQPSAPAQQQPIAFDASKYNPVFYGYQSPIVSSKSRL